MMKAINPISTRTSRNMMCEYGSWDPVALVNALWPKPSTHDDGLRMNAEKRSIKFAKRAPIAWSDLSVLSHRFAMSTSPKNNEPMSVIMKSNAIEPKERRKNWKMFLIGRDSGKKAITRMTEKKNCPREPEKIDKMIPHTKARIWSWKKFRSCYRN